MVYPGRVKYDYFSAFPDVAPMKNPQVEVAKSLKTVFSTLESLSIVPYNMQYRVVGNTGIVWEYYTENVKEKGQPGRTRYNRHTSTWIKSDGKCFNIMYHNSAIPSSH